LISQGLLLLLLLLLTMIGLLRFQYQRAFPSVISSVCRSRATGLRRRFVLAVS
jgi:hypothetical protein